MIKMIKNFIKDKSTHIGKFLSIEWFDTTIFILSFVVSWVLFDIFFPNVDFF